MLRFICSAVMIRCTSMWSDFLFYAYTIVSSEVVPVWVSPRSPHQEDMVSFSAEIANVGGTDANGFLVQVYLDGTLWDSGRASLAAGSSTTFTSNPQYQAEDGPHDVRCLVNSDGAVQESNYGNNEGNGTFFVSPRTVTRPEHATVTKTKTQTEKQTLTITATRTVTRAHTTDTTAIGTVTASPVVVTSTLTGLVTSTVYSPTITTTVTATAAIVSNPLLWLMASTYAVIGAVFQMPKSDRLRGFYRRLSTLLPISELFAWRPKREVRKAIFAICVMLVVVLSILSQTGQEAFASTATTTRTATGTEWTTITQSLTSTRYVTSTVTSTLARKTTITPTQTQTVDHRSETTIFVPTTTTRTTTAALSTCDASFLKDDPHFKYYKEESKHFVVCYRSGTYEGDVEKVKSYADSAHESLGILGYNVPSDKEWTIWIVMQTKGVSLASLCGSTYDPDGCVPDSSILWGTNRIIINWSALGYGDTRILHIIAHEIAHVVSFLYVRYQPWKWLSPKWAIEGFAEFAAFKVTGEDDQSALWQAIPFKDNDFEKCNFDAPTEASRCYASAYSFYKFVASKRGGDGVVKNALVEFGTTWAIWDPIKTAIKNATHADFDDLKREWQEWDPFG